MTTQTQALATIPRTPVEEFALLCRILHEERIILKHHDWATIRECFRIYRAQALASLMPVERNSSGLGGDSKQKVTLVATPAELAQWCLAQSRRLGINRDNPRGEFYVPPPTAQDFARLTLPSSEVSNAHSTTQTPAR